jgi:hypothetical protein
MNSIPSKPLCQPLIESSVGKFKIPEKQKDVEHFEQYHQLRI